MTDVRKYKGKAITATERAETPLGNGGRYVNVDKLTLSDGAVVYGCVECDYAYVADKATAVAAHLRSHRAIVDLTTIASMPLAEAMTRLLEKDDTKAADWRSRAIVAERKLARLTKILGVDPDREVEE